MSRHVLERQPLIPVDRVDYYRDIAVEHPAPGLTARGMLMSGTAPVRGVAMAYIPWGTE